MHATIFDIDGTLLQSAEKDDELYQAAVRRVLGPVRFRDSMHEYEFVSDSGILQQVLLDNQLQGIDDPTPAIVAQFVMLLRSHIAEKGAFREVPGAKRYLSALRQSPDHYVAFATGGWAASARLKLESANFDTGDAMLSASDNEHDRVAIMQAALDRPADGYSSITYYGDGPWDRDACLRLGWNFVAVGSNLDGIESYGELALTDRGR